MTEANAKAFTAAYTTGSGATSSSAGDEGQSVKVGEDGNTETSCSPFLKKVSGQALVGLHKTLKVNVTLYKLDLKDPNAISDLTASSSKSKSKTGTMATTISHKGLKSHLANLKASSHPNLLVFITSLYTSSSNTSFSDSSAFYVVHPHQQNGTLLDALSGLKFPLNDAIKFALCRDLCRGLEYLHHGPGANLLGGFHGRLWWGCCFVDEFWRLKVGGGILGSAVDGLGGVVDLEGGWGIGGDEMYCVAPELLVGLGETTGVEGKLGGRKERCWGDVYAVGVLMNMIMCDGMLPYSEAAGESKETILAKIKNGGPPLRPLMAEGVGEGFKKLIAQAWSAAPESRPTVSYLLNQLQTPTVDPNGYYQQYHHDHPATPGKLVALHAADTATFLQNLESAQMKLSATLGSTLTTKLSESASKIQKLTKQLQHEKERANKAVDEAKREMLAREEDSGAELGRLKKLVGVLDREALGMRYSLLPKPLADLIVTQSLTAASNHHSKTPAFLAAFQNQNAGSPQSSHNDSNGSLSMTTTSMADLIFQPTLYESATIMVTSIAGFNRHIQAYVNYPKQLVELLRAYYQAIDDAILDLSKSSGDGTGSGDGVGKVYVAERICDAVILVAGAPERTSTHAADILEVALRIIKWAANFGESSGFGNGKLGLRVGVHSGPVLAGMVNVGATGGGAGGGIPKLVLMGGE
jgi:serine/threonine protein kinase